MEIIQDGYGRHLRFVRTGNCAIGSAVPENPTIKPKMNGSHDRLRKYGHLKFFQDGGCRHLRFVRTQSSAISSAVSENPTLEPNMKWIGPPVAEIWPFEIFPRWRRPPSWICSNWKQRYQIRRHRKPHLRTKHDVDRTTGCGDIVT